MRPLFQSTHLWRGHRLDLELLSCPDCPTYKTHSMAKMDTHRLTHQVKKGGKRRLGKIILIIRH